MQLFLWRLFESVMNKADSFERYVRILSWWGSHIVVGI